MTKTGLVKLNSIEQLTSTDNFHIIRKRVYKYYISPFGGNEIIYKLYKRPNVWIRFWMWIFFNWRFKLI